jgi:hypothetical protein
MSLIQINMDQPTGGLVGTHLWEVKSATPGTSKKGDNMLTVVYKCWPLGHTSEAEFRDIIMLTGPGFAIGKPRLQALGIMQTGVFDLTELIGRKVWIHTIEEPDTFQGKDGQMRSVTRLRSDANKLTHKGYQPADSVPAGCDPATYDLGSTPF